MAAKHVKVSQKKVHTKLFNWKSCWLQNWINFFVSVIEYHFITRGLHSCLCDNLRIMSCLSNNLRHNIIPFDDVKVKLFSFCKFHNYSSRMILRPTFPLNLGKKIMLHLSGFPTLYSVTSASTVPARTHMPVVRVASFFSTMYWMTGVPPSVSGGSHDTVM